MIVRDNSMNDLKCIIYHMQYASRQLMLPFLFFILPTETILDTTY